MSTTANGKLDEGLQLLVVDDDPGIRELLCRYLGEQGFRVSAVQDGRSMDEWLAENTADLVILDLMLPGEDGLSLARRLRSDHKLPIVMISARGEEVDRIVGLEVGADDYLPKPFNPRELLARVRAVLRRNWPTTSPAEDEGARFSFGPFRFERDKRALYRDANEVDLSRAEFELLEVLIDHPNRVLSRDFIMECLRGNDRDPFDRSIDVRVTRLRHKIEENPAQPRFVRTVWGIGYQFTPEEPTT
ncbi:MAG: response regulator [Gammaproteobacteria bacterium]|nr:response regulator [Gammaproteobacteria bacterium]MDH3750063.1 response regulator [Gammaproteobacteria bacterium]MDH3804715.1 response regulator [Gammaproteobacteria bacterium]